MKALMQTAPSRHATPTGRELEEQNPGIFTGAVYVVFTSIEETLIAVQVAAGFAKRSDCR